VSRSTNRSMHKGLAPYYSATVIEGWLADEPTSAGPRRACLERRPLATTGSAAGLSQGRLLAREGGTLAGLVIFISVARMRQGR